MELAAGITIVPRFFCGIVISFFPSGLRFGRPADRIRGNVSKYCATANGATAFELLVTNAPSLVICLVFTMLELHFRKYVRDLHLTLFSKGLIGGISVLWAI